MLSFFYLSLGFHDWFWVHSCSVFQVIFHYITRTTEGVVVESSRADHGGRGAPLRMVLGKSKMIAGWEEGLPTMLKGETAMLKIRPDLHYADPECPVTVAENFPKGA
jgi:FKBP-type peptidyl-prolyl cis-trans isomerase